MKKASDLVQKEVIAGLFSLCAVLLVSVLFSAPLAGPGDPAGIPSDHVKAPWIFVGIQQMLRHMAPLVAGVVIPLCLLVAVASIPFVPAGNSFGRALFFGIALICTILTLWGYAT